MYKAIIQLTSDDRRVYRSMIRQVNNLLDYFSGDIQVRIVCHGASLPFCMAESNVFQSEIQALLLRRVVVVVCHNMLVSNGKSETGLIAGLEIIPSAIADLVIKQQQGWSYVKAG
ncbi:hypothetical protein GCM10007423_01300 [Dyadobacter endophyticus]|uniref:DsrE/DsrF-like family protein n=1 Tax=Dyadobacter endophyticus TaxID=1749036 RepID=A0ABQ1YD10_9BACT|nr:DsrE family protein [Dyadobacter endophyticus]GGH20732.1 hypothetical protein GCM10007423_01300 [Dyadobacter endophyticus]